MGIEGFYPYINELANNILKFKDEHLRDAKVRFNRLHPKSKTMVSIHIRLTDFKRHLRYHWNMNYASDDYFRRAMSYFHKKYKVG